MRPREDWRDAGVQRLKELKGEDEYVAYLAGEIGPGIYRVICTLLRFPSV